MTHEDLLRVMEMYPNLTYFGFVIGWCPAEEIRQEREQLRGSDPALLSAIETLLRPVRRTRRVGYLVPGSYGLKHVVEKIVGQYVSNGQLIAVALHLGFRHRVRGPNADFNMSRRDVLRLEAAMVQKIISKIREAIERHAHK